jgi:hypothetical protein
MDQISEADIARSRADPRFKQILLARTLEQLLGTLHRLQRDPAHSDPVSMREGAMMAVRLADMIHAIDEEVRPAASA